MADSPRRRDVRVDTCIATAAPFARPILEHLRDVVHAACPDVVEDVWGKPFFVRERSLRPTAAFKAHCTFGFRREREPDGLPPVAGADATGRFGWIIWIDDLPSVDMLIAVFRTAARRGAPDEASAVDRGEAGADGPGGPRRLARCGSGRSGALRRDESELQARVHRPDRRGRTAADPRAADRDDGRVERRRQVAGLEVRDGAAGMQPLSGTTSDRVEGDLR